MSAANPVSEAALLEEMVSPLDEGFKPEAAEAILRLRFSDETYDRIRALLDANNRDALSEQEKRDLEKYLRVGQLLDLLHAKARLCLNKA